MKPTIRWLLVFGLLASATPATAALQSNKITWGYVQAIHGRRDNTSLTLATASGTRTLRIVPGQPTAISDDTGHAISFDKLSLGDWVRVDFQSDAPGSPREQDWIMGVEDLSKPVQVNSATTSPVTPTP